MLHFFIDTNVLLSFYAFTQDDLARLESLAAEVERGAFVVLSTPQIQNEFRRNREAKIAESRKDFSNQRLDMRFPRLCDPYAETEELRQLARTYSSLHTQLLKRIDDDARDRALKADHLVERFFQGAQMVPIEKEAVERANHRVALGNPPGKRGSLGDAVNWEALLMSSPSDHLFFVTDDGDFYSPLDKDRAHEYLTTEWGAHVGKPITFVRRLSELPSPVPHEVLPVNDAPDQRDELVAGLLNSGHFQQTHGLIAALAHVSTFTPPQVRDIVAALDNSQVLWILDDVDVHSFYTWLLGSHASAMSESDEEFLRKLLSRADPADTEMPEGFVDF